MIKIYITHYTPLVDRKNNIIKQLNYYNIENFEFVTEYDRENLENILLNKFINLKMAEISLFMKHIKTYENIINDNDNDNEYFLILEDDVILCDNFYNNLLLYLKQLPSNYDILCIGNGCNMHAKNTDNNNNIYVADSIRCTDSYFISKQYAQILLNNFYSDKIINLPVDHWINYVYNNNCSFYWAEPTIVYQGSESGFFKSSIR
jgi:GR25 family glycosyltransferase involved in LPS biosynthesis